MIQEGIVKSIQGNIVWIQAPNPVSCSSSEGCHSSNCCSSKPVMFRAKRNESQRINEGDYVRLAPPPGSAFLDLALYFGLPLVFAAVSYTIALSYLADYALPLAFVVGFVSLIVPAMIKNSSQSLPSVVQVVSNYGLYKKTPS